MSEYRFDSYPLKIADKIGANGYLTLPAIITRAGVFNYKQADGSVIRELRHPDEVFKPRSLKSLEQVPLITEKDHLRCVEEGIPINKVSEFTTLGTLSNRTDRNSRDEVESDVTVYRPETIIKIDSGEERQLSAGYTVDIVKEAGEYNGQSYDQKQTNIIYGHVAVVRRGRAGTAGFRIDSKAAILSNNDDSQPQEENLVEKTIVKKEIPALNVGQGEHRFRLDSLSVEETDGVLSLLNQRNTLINKCEEAQSRADRAEGEISTLKADKQALEEKLKKAIPEDRLDAEVEERALLSNMCSFMEIDTKGKTSVELKRAICMKDKPGVYEEKRLDGDFLEGAFAPIAANWENQKKDIQTLKGVELSLMNQKTGNKTPISYGVKS